MATNVADLFAQAVATQMPNVFYIAPPERGAVATYGNPFDSSKYDTGTGRNTTPSWMQNDDLLVGGGPFAPQDMDNPFLMTTPLARPKREDPRGPVVGHVYSHTDPFAGTQGGASGRGNSVEQPVEGGWVAPVEVREGDVPGSPQDFTEADMKALAEAKGTQYNPDMWQKFQKWVDAQSAGGSLVDWTRIATDIVLQAVTPSPFQTVGSAAFNATGDPLIATIAGTTAETLAEKYSDSPMNPWSWGRHATGILFDGQRPGDEIPTLPQPEVTGYSYQPLPVEDRPVEYEIQDVIPVDGPEGRASGLNIVSVPIEPEPLPLSDELISGLINDPFNATTGQFDRNTGTFTPESLANASVNSIADALMPLPAEMQDNVTGTETAGVPPPPLDTGGFWQNFGGLSSNPFESGTIYNDGWSDPYYDYETDYVADVPWIGTGPRGKG